MKLHLGCGKRYIKGFTHIIVLKILTHKQYNKKQDGKL